MKMTQKISQVNSLDAVAWFLLAISLCFPVVALKFQFSEPDENLSLTARGTMYRSAVLERVERDYPPAYPALESQILQTDPQDWALVERAICLELAERSADSPQQIANELTPYVPQEFRSISAGVLKAANCS